jgi:hypothetical protein
MIFFNLLRILSCIKINSSRLFFVYTGNGSVAKTTLIYRFSDFEKCFLDQISRLMMTRISEKISSPFGKSQAAPLSPTEHAMIL